MILDPPRWLVFSRLLGRCSTPFAVCFPRLLLVLGVGALSGGASFEVREVPGACRERFWRRFRRKGASGTRSQLKPPGEGRAAAEQGLRRSYGLVVSILGQLAPLLAFLLFVVLALVLLLL